MLKELNLWVILQCILTRALITIYPSWLWQIRMRHCITKGDDRLLSMHKDTIVCRSTSSRMLSNWCFPAPCSRPHYSSCTLLRLRFRQPTEETATAPKKTRHHFQSTIYTKRMSLCTLSAQRKYRDESCSIVKSNLRIFRVNGQFVLHRLPQLFTGPFV